MMDRLIAFFIRASRVPRKPYTYLTGNRTCLGYVRFMMLVAVINMGVRAAIDFQRSELTDAGFGFAGVVGIFVLAAPRIFRDAAAADMSRLGPAATNHASWLTLVGDVLSYAFICALWAIRDRDGGDGKRTLAGDVRRFLGRPTPVPVPA